MAKKRRDTDVHILLIIFIISLISFKVGSIFLILFIIYFLGRVFNIEVNINKIKYSKSISKEAIKKFEKNLSTMKIKGEIIKNINIKIGNKYSKFSYLILTEKGALNIELFNGSEIVERKSFEYLEKEKNIQRYLLSNILSDNYKIYNIVVLTNSSAIRVGEEPKNIKVFNIKEFNDFITDINTDKSILKSEFQEMCNKINLYKNSKISVKIGEINVFLKENISLISFVSVLTLFLVCVWQFTAVPTTIMNNLNKKAHATFENKETYAINKSVFFNDIGVEVSLLSVSKTDHGAVLELVIGNKSNVSIKPKLFNFNIIDNFNGENYDIILGDHDVIKDGEKKIYTFKVEDFPVDFSDITLNINYDDFIEYRLNDTIDVTIK